MPPSILQKDRYTIRKKTDSMNPAGPGRTDEFAGWLSARDANPTRNANKHKTTTKSLILAQDER